MVYLMTKSKKFIIAVAFLLFSMKMTFPWEKYDRVLAIVNNMPIVESEVFVKFDQLKKLKKISGSKINYEKSRVLDQFIENSLVLETAREESIIISDDRILDQIENMINQYLDITVRDDEKLETLMPKIKSRIKQYLNGTNLDPKDEVDKNIIGLSDFIEGKQKIGLKPFIEEIRSQMRKEQVMSIAIGVSPPSKEEAMAW